jgi:hypothetical protein
MQCDSLQCDVVVSKDLIFIRNITFELGCQN